MTYGLPALGGASGSAAGTYLSGGNPLVGVLGGASGSMAGRVASEQINRQIGNGVKRGRGRPRKGMSGSGWLSGLLDKPFTARQAIQGAKKIPGLAREAINDVKGAGLASDMSDMAMYGVVGKRVPKVKGLTSGAVQVPGVSSGVVSMGGSGMGKGSEAMKQKMARLRAMRGKK